MSASKSRTPKKSKPPPPKEESITVDSGETSPLEQVVDTASQVLNVRARASCMISIWACYGFSSDGIQTSGDATTWAAFLVLFDTRCMRSRDHTERFSGDGIVSCYCLPNQPRTDVRFASEFLEVLDSKRAHCLSYSEAPTQFENGSYCVVKLKETKICPMIF